MRVWKSLCKTICLSTGLWALSACKPGVPSGLIQPDDMEEILYDYHLAQAMAETGGRRDSVDVRRYRYVRAVFDKYGITEAEFDTAMVWYSSHASYLNEMYQRLRERYGDHVAALGAATGEGDLYANLDAQGDTANIWQGQAFRVLKPRFAEDRMTFTLKADTTFHRGDDLLWRFDARHISRGRTSETYAGFYVRYDNDSTAGVTQRLYSTTRAQLRLAGDTAHAIREIRGFVYCKPVDTDEDERLLVLHNLMLVRFHRKAEPEQADTARASAMGADSLGAVADTASRHVPAGTNRRLSPTELRDSRPVERSIKVVKEKPYRVIRGNARAPHGSREGR